jgi:hypothetical protein
VEKFHAPKVDKIAAPKQKPATLRLSGQGGHTASTVAGHNIAKKRFGVFLEFIEHTKKNFDDLNENELCDLTLWQQFGTYLSEHAVQNNMVMAFCRNNNTK